MRHHPFSILLTAALLALAGGPAAAQFTAFNDHYSGPNTHVNATAWNVYGTTGGAPGSTGPLRDITSGATLPAGLNVTNNGVGGGTSAAGPAAGTPAGNAFNAYIDWGSGTLNHAVQIGAGQFVGHVFIGLDPNKRYTFRGTAVRGGGYLDRWTVFELSDVDAFTSAHTPNVLTTTQVPAIAANQAVVNTGANDLTGDMVVWENIAAGADGSFTVISRQYTGTIPGGSSAGPYAYALAALRLDEFNVTPTAAAITNQPQSITVAESTPATFRVGISGNPSPAVQWYKNDVLIQNATNLTYTVTRALMGESGARFSAVASNYVNNAARTATSSAAILTVNPDTNAPTLVRAATLSSTQVELVFSEPVTAASATNLSNYTITSEAGTLALTSIALGLGETNIVIQTAAQTEGLVYTLRVSNIRDISAAGNLIAPNSTITFGSVAYAGQNVGNASRPVVVTVNPGGGYNISAGGADINNNSDQFGFAYQQRTGDFDIRTRVEGIGLTDAFAKAGLMARETLDANARFAAALTTPAMAGSFFASRLSLGGAASYSGNFPPNGADTYLRLRRSGNVFTAFAGFDGDTWIQLGTSTIAMPGTIFFGMAVTSHDTNASTVVQFRGIGPVTNPVIGTLPTDVEPLGPSTRRTSLVISEIMYNPAPRTDGRVLEYIEIHNTNPYFEEIGGYKITGDIDYTFAPNATIPGGGFIVLARNPADVSAVYGISGVLGPYTGTLPKSGQIRLRNDQGSVYLDIPYSNDAPWPIAANGTGHSLSLVRPSYGEGNAQAWGISDVVGGSPGGYDSVHPSPLRSLLINEWLAHSSPGSLDYVELYNHGNLEVDISGCFLSDSATSNKFAIPAGTRVAPRGFVSFTEAQMGFALKSSGEKLYLKTPDARRVLDAVSFSAQALDIASGRYPDGADAFYPLARQTPGAANSVPAVHDIVINELMYNPISGNPDDEYVELYNKGTNPVSVSGWRFIDGISYTFGSNVVIAANGYLVVAKNLTNLLGNYPQLNAGNAVGNFSGALSGSGERVALARLERVPIQQPNGSYTTNSEYVVVDEVNYGTGGRWGRWADGGGSSLELIDPRSNHRLASNWADSDETAKATWSTIEMTGLLDLGATVGGAPINRLEITMLGAGECLLDNVEVIPGLSGGNLVSNPTFESNTAGWTMQGTHIRSNLETNRIQNVSGYQSSQSLHVRASARGDTGANRIRTALTSSLAVGQTATLRARVRWLTGWPEMVLRVNGNYLEAVGRFNVPRNLGTPGQPNSRALPNAGPAIHHVQHSPALPGPTEPVVVTAQVDDPDGLASLAVVYRIDPSQTTTSVAMKDDGTGGDAVAGDGVFSATIPPTSGSLIAFYVTAQDRHANAATARFPNDAPVRECLVRFGDAYPPSTFGTYRLWLTQNNVNNWINRPSLSNEPIEGTFVYNNYRVIYNMGSHYAGSPYHQGWSSPLGNCHFSIDLPGDDVLLGTANFNKIHAPGNGAFDDNTGQREQAAYWMARQLKLPWNYRRYINFYVNGTRKASVMEDTQTPGSDVVKSVFPNDADGNLYKLQPWFEFDDVTVTGGTSAGFANQSWCTMNNYVTTNNLKKLARYRYQYLTRNANGTANDYAPVYNLVDTANTPAGGLYTQNMEALIDMEEWLRIFAVEHAVGNWDSFGNRNSQNMYGYKPRNGKWKLLIWDFNIVLGNSGSDGPGANLFQYQTADTAMARLNSNPPFRRAWWRGYKDIVKGPMAAGRMDPMLYAKYNAFRDNGYPLADPSVIVNWISQARTSISQQLAAVDTTNFVVSGTNTIVTSSNLVTLTGTAPVDVKSVTVNGNPWPVTWSSITGWSISFPVTPGTNTLTVAGLNLNGQTVAGATTQVTVIFNGQAPDVRGSVVFNEIMYNPAKPDAEFVELFNSTTNFTFDISNWRIQGLDYTFPAATALPAQSYIVLTRSRTAFASAYGSGAQVFGEYGGLLQGNGEALTLIKPGATPASDVIVNKVRYENRPGWNVAADGTGSSLELLDPSSDNTRPGLWSAKYNAGGTNYGWRFVSTTANLGGTARLYIFLQSLGDVYVDDIFLAMGPVAEAGTNYIRNGEFEAPLLEDPVPANGFNIPTNYITSEISSTVKHSGNSSLHLISTGTGNTQSRVIYQNVAPAPTGQVATLSFWYLPNSDDNVLNIKMLVTQLDIRAGTQLTNTPPTVTATPGQSNSVLTSVPAVPTIWLNEVQPENVNGITDVTGTREPWVELHNTSSNTVSLTGLSLSDTYANTLLWSFPPGSSLAPGEFKVIFLDGEPTQSTATEWHTSFRIRTSGAIILSRQFNGAPQILDYLNYTAGPDRTYGSYPDGQNFTRQQFFLATPGAPNNPMLPAVSVFINEWMASNTRTLSDAADGKFDDWFEIFNPGPNPVDLAGYYLTGTLTNKTKFRVPAGYAIPAGGHLLVWADNEPAQNSATRPDLHVNFQLAKSGEAIGIFTPDGTQIDAVVFGPQTSDVSEGRYPDGSAQISFLTNATPRASNRLGSGNTPPFIPVIPDQLAQAGELWSLQVNATDNDIPLQALTYQLDAGSPGGMSVNENTGLVQWVPDSGAVGLHTVYVRATDSGFPPLSTSRGFVIRVSAPLRVQGFTRASNGQVQLQFSTITGKTYRVEYTDSLTGGSWTPLGGDRVSSGSNVSVTDSTAGTPMRFYRIRQLD